MNRNDTLLAIICGLSVAWIGNDFYPKYGLIFLVLLPILSVVGIWLADLIGKKYLFVRQAGKFVLAGAFADVVDIKVFQILFFFAPFSLLFKAISFMVAVYIKYLADKHWSFEKHGKEGQGKEMLYFLFVALVGLIINVVFFYFINKMNFGLPTAIWTELSIILAAIGAGLWNFLGYKFIVFKK